MTTQIVSHLPLVSADGSCKLEFSYRVTAGGFTAAGIVIAPGAF